MKIFVADTISEAGLDYLRNHPASNVIFTPGLSQEEVCAKIGDADAIIVRSATKVTREVIEAAPNLTVIGRAGIGTDNIDIEAATERGIVVLNTPDSNATTTAELALAHLFSLSRHLPAASESVRAGQWQRSRYMGAEITGKTIGIIGYGTIGRIVAARCNGLKMRVVAYDPFVTAETFKHDCVEPMSLEDLLGCADYVSLHCPLIPATDKIINRETLAQIKQGARLINCARGGLVDEDALLEVLRSGHLAGAALDVFQEEPPLHSPLLQQDNVVFTPHLGASTHEAQIAVGVAIAEQVIGFLDDGEAINAINLPRLSVEDRNRMQPYMELAQKLGRVLISMCPEALTEVDVTVEGQAAEFDPHPIAVETLIGILSNCISHPVNAVNAVSLANRQGISIQESRSDKACDYVSLLTVTGHFEGGKIRLIGTLLGGKLPRLVGVNDYEVEAVLNGTILITQHIDQPGVVGALGETLGKGNINITGMHVGDCARENKAMAVIGVSSVLDAELIRAVENIPAIEHVCQVSL